MQGNSGGDYRRVSEFLIREAQALNDWRLEDWLRFLAPEYIFRLSVRDLPTAETRQASTLKEALLAEEDYLSLVPRVRQLLTAAYTVAESPRSRVRRFVTNILIEEERDGGDVRVTSSSLIYRTRAGQTAPDIFSVGRSDILRETDGVFVLLSRDAVLDEPVVNAHNITGIL